MLLDQTRNRKIGKTGLTVIGVLVAVGILAAGVIGWYSTINARQNKAVEQVEEGYPQFHRTAQALDAQLKDHGELLANPVFSSTAWKTYVSDEGPSAIEPTTDVLSGIKDVRKDITSPALLKRLDSLSAKYKSEITEDTVLKARAIGLVKRVCDANGDIGQAGDTTLMQQIARVGVATECPAAGRA